MEQFYGEKPSPGVELVVFACHDRWRLFLRRVVDSLVGA